MNASPDPPASAARSTPPPPAAEPWVRWTYTPEEWAAFNRQDENQIEQSWRNNLAAYGVVFLLILGFCAWFSFGRDWDESAGVRLFFTLFTPLVVVGGALFLTRQEYNLGQLLWRARQRGPREIAIGPDSLREGRMVYAWRAGSAQLTHVRFEDGEPPVLVFRTTRPVSGTPIDVEIQVPIPAGREAEARQVVERFMQQLAPRNR